MGSSLNALHIVRDIFLNVFPYLLNVEGKKVCETRVSLSFMNQRH